MTAAESRVFVTDVMLPDIINHLQGAINSILGTQDAQVVILVAFGAEDGTILSTIGRAGAVAMMADAASKIALEVAASEGPVQ